jgi:hypothetical protein
VKIGLAKAARDLVPKLFLQEILAMHFAYLSTDEVNQASALEIAADLHVDLSILTPKDKPPDKEFDALLCDWDSWPTGGRAAFLAIAAHDPLALCAAAHGYNFTDEEAESLLYNGVIVCRILEPEVFRVLIEATPLELHQAERKHESTVRQRSSTLALTSN